MYKDLKFLAAKQMHDNAVTPDDIVFGKAMLYNQSIEKKFVKNIANYK
jgi:hypothetical protein